MAQVKALIWLRFHLLLSAKRLGVAGSILQGIVFLVAITGAVGAYFVLVLLFRALPGPMAVQTLHVALAAVWAAWILFPLMGVSFDDSTDLSKLLLYPMTPGQMALGVLLSDLLSAPAGITVLLAVPMGWARHAGDAAVALAAIALLAVHIAALVESLRIALWDLLRSRRTRDWAVLLTPFFGVGIYLLQAVIFRRASAGGLARLLTVEPSHYLQFLPSGLAASAVVNASAERYPSSLAYLAGLLAVAGVTVAVMARLVRHVQAGEADVARRVAREHAVERRRARRGFALPVPEAVATVARKELLLFWRDPHLKTRVIQAAVAPVVWVVFMALSPGGGLGEMALFLVPVGLMLFGSFMLSANQFGFEGDAVSTLFLFPTSRRAILAGKNLALWAVFMVVYTPALVLLAGMSRQWGLLPLAWLGVGVALLISLGVGNFLSIYAPYRFPARRQNPFATRSGGPGCLGFLLGLLGNLAVGIIGAPLGAALVLPLALGGPAWYWLTLPATLAYTAWLYRALLGWAAGRVLSREPEIVQAVGPAAAQ